MRRKQIITTGSRQRQRQVMLAALAAEHRVVRLNSEELTGRYKDIEEATAGGDEEARMDCYQYGVVTFKGKT